MRYADSALKVSSFLVRFGAERWSKCSPVGVPVGIQIGIPRLAGTRRATLLRWSKCSHTQRLARSALRFSPAGSACLWVADGCGRSPSQLRPRGHRCDRRSGRPFAGRSATIRVAGRRGAVSAVKQHVSIGIGRVQDASAETIKARKCQPANTSAAASTASNIHARTLPTGAGLGDGGLAAGAGNRR